MPNKSLFSWKQSIQQMQFFLSLSRKKINCFRLKKKNTINFFSQLLYLILSHCLSAYVINIKSSTSCWFRNFSKLSLVLVHHFLGPSNPMEALGAVSYVEFLNLLSLTFYIQVIDDFSWKILIPLLFWLIRTLVWEKLELQILHITISTYVFDHFINWNIRT